jgi:hypothetical protein
MNRENSRLEKLLKEQEQVENRIKQIQAKKSSQKRKLMAEKIINQIESRQSMNKRAIETRKKILLGAMLQEWVRTGEIEQSTLDQGLDRYLVRKRDRELFGLAGSGEADGGVKV